MIAQNKLIYDSISKIGKSIKAEPSFANHSMAMNFNNQNKSDRIKKQEINTIISEHLFRNGRFEAGEKFCTESDVQLGDEFKQRFRILDQILTDLNEKSVKRAIEWVDLNLIKLRLCESELPFLVRKVEF